MSVNNTNLSLPDKVNLHYYLYTDRVLLFAITNGICLLAFIANGIVLYLTKKYHQFHSAGMYVRAGYAFVDMLTAIFLIIHSNLRLATLEFNEDLEEITCWIASLMGGLFFATVQMTAIISIERYFYFCEPMKYPRYFTLASITTATFSVLFVSEGYMIFTQIFIGRETPSYFNSCRLADQSFHKRIQILVFFVPAMGCTCFSIFKIARLIRTLSSPEEATTIMKKAVGHKTLRMILLISGTFWGTLIPVQIIHTVVYQFGYTLDNLIESPTMTRIILHSTLLPITSLLLDPIIYCLVSKDLRIAVVRLFKKNYGTFSWQEN